MFFEVFEHARAYSDPFGPVRIHSDAFGRVRMPLEAFRRFWKFQYFCRFFKVSGRRGACPDLATGQGARFRHPKIDFHGTGAGGWPVGVARSFVFFL